MKPKPRPTIPEDLKVIHARCVLLRSCIKTQSNTTSLQTFQVTSCGFVNRPSSDIFLYQEPSSEN